MPRFKYTEDVEIVDVYSLGVVSVKCSEYKCLQSTFQLQRRHVVFFVSNELRD